MKENIGGAKKNIKIRNLQNNLNSKNNLNDEILHNLCTDLDRDFGISDSQHSTNIKGKNLANLPKNNLKVSDGDLLTSMTKRLNLVEKQLTEANKKLKELNLQNQVLKMENEKLSVNNADNSKKIQNNINCPNCKIWKKEVEELNEIMKDMRNKEKMQIQNENSDVEEEIDYLDRKIPSEIDINIISQRIEELNMLLYKDGNITKFEQDQDDKIFKLKQMKELNVYFYKNGLIIEGYKFYPFESVEAKKILHDILDGYTPYILMKQYPNGALLKAVNNLHREYNKEEYSNNLKSVNGPMVKIDKISGKEFLDKFPEKVIRDGKIFNIRNDMEQFVHVKRDNEYNLDKEEHYINFNKDNEKDFKDRICKLKIKFEIVDKIITVNALKEESLKIIFEYLKNCINLGVKGKIKQQILIDKIENYVLYSTYPFIIYTYDNNKNLEENKLFPSHFLIFDEKSKIENRK